MLLRSVALMLSLGAVTSACGEEPSPREPGSAEVIQALDRHDLSVEDFDVCEAITSSGAEVDVAGILGADSVELKSGYADMEDASFNAAE